MVFLLLFFSSGPTVTADAVFLLGAGDFFLLGSGLSSLSERLLFLDLDLDLDLDLGLRLALDLDRDLDFDLGLDVLAKG